MFNKFPCAYLFGSALSFSRGRVVYCFCSEYTMMDLQLGLAVSRNSASTKDFDLNFSEVEFNSNNNNNNNMEQRCRPRRGNHVKKRGFYEASSFSSEEKEEEKNVVDQTLPLLLWNDDQPKPNYQEEEDDVDQDNLDSSSSTDITDNNYKIDERGTNGLVGWPPINPLRKRICHQSINLRGGFGGYSVTVENGGTAAASANNRGKNSSLYVKVKMEGVGIARKVDISLHHSSHTLLQTLLTMFGKCQESIHSYLLSFQDQEGDWQRADQVPWRVFIGSVQRLKLHRKTTD